MIHLFPELSEDTSYAWILKFIYSRINLPFISILHELVEIPLQVLATEIPTTTTLQDMNLGYKDVQVSLAPVCICTHLFSCLPAVEAMVTGDFVFQPARRHTVISLISVASAFSLLTPSHPEKLSFRHINISAIVSLSFIF